MENITELVRCRRSVRTFDGKEINEDDRKKLALFMEKKENGINICFNVSDPGIKADAGTEYIASYLLPQ